MLLLQALITQGFSRSALCRSGDRGAVITWSRSVRIPQVTADALPQPSRDRIATHDTEIETCRDFFLLSGHLSSRCRDCLLEPGAVIYGMPSAKQNFNPEPTGTDTMMRVREPVGMSGSEFQMLVA